MPKTKPFSIALLVLASFAICALVFELALRLIGYEGQLDFANGRERIVRPSPHPLVRYELIPGATGIVWDTPVDINAHGFRGRDAAPTPRPDYRVLVLGDSIAFGIFLGVKGTFAHQLQQLLDAGPGDFQVLNFAVGGYDTLQEVALLEARGLEYRPDLVIVAYCLNDIGIVSPNLAFTEQLEEREGNPLLRLRSLQFVGERRDRIKIRDWTARKNSAEVFGREYAGQIDPIGDDEDALLALMDGVSREYPSPWYRSRDRVGRLRFSFRWLARLSQEQGFPVLVAIIPWLVADDSGYPHATAHRIVESEARRAGFDVIDLSEPFSNAGIRDLRVSPMDRIHPGRAGHGIIAAALEREVRARADAGLR